VDFQEAFLTLFWPVWAWMLGVAVAGAVLVAICWILTRFTRFSTPKQISHRFAGERDSDEPKL